MDRLRVSQGPWPPRGAITHWLVPQGVFEERVLYDRAHTGMVPGTEVDCGLVSCICASNLRRRFSCDEFHAVGHMKISGTPYRSIWVTPDGIVRVIDQRRLPFELATL